MDTAKLNKLIRASLRGHGPKRSIAEALGIPREGLYARFNGSIPWRLHELLKLARICGVQLSEWIEEAEKI